VRYRDLIQAHMARNSRVGFGDKRQLGHNPVTAPQGVNEPY
jgi:hypothetical protein